MSDMENRNYTARKEKLQRRLDKTGYHESIIGSFLYKQLQAEYQKVIQGRYKHSTLFKLLGLDRICVILAACLLESIRQAETSTPFIHRLGKRCVLEFKALNYKKRALNLYKSILKREAKKGTTNTEWLGKRLEKTYKALAMYDHDLDHINTTNLGQHLYLLSCMSGVITHSWYVIKKRKETVFALHPDIESELSRFNATMFSFTKVNTFLLRPPIDWNANGTRGIWHTEAYRANARLMKRRGQVSLNLVRTVNRLQKVGFTVHGRLLAFIEDCVKNGVSHNEMIYGFNKEKPKREDFENVKAFSAQAKRWHTERKQSVSKSTAFMAVFHSAKQHIDDCLYFGYEADKRHRIYAISHAISPQGTDLEKALLQFAAKEKVTQDSVFILSAYAISLYTGKVANFRKKISNEDQIFIDHLLNQIAVEGFFNTGKALLKRADKPFQFLAILFELYDIVKGGKTETGAVVYSDGTCNGLQHMSAIARDVKGGWKVNLLYSEEKQDIYKDIGQKAKQLLLASDIDNKKMLLAIDDFRNLVKKSVMTLPYGITDFGIAENIYQDSLYPLYSVNVSGKILMRLAVDFAKRCLIPAMETELDGAMRLMKTLQHIAEKKLEKEGTLTWSNNFGATCEGVYKKTSSIRVTGTLGRQFKIETGHQVNTPHTLKKKVSPPLFPILPTQWMQPTSNVWH